MAVASKKKQYDLETLQAMTPDKRFVLYNNAKKIDGGQYIVDLIDNNGLSLSAAVIGNEDPAYLRMVEIAWSVEGREAAINASKADLPALCGVDPLFRQALGEQYHKHNRGTFAAGSAVAQVMKHLGYRDKGRKGKCPDTCVARTGIIWE